MMPSLGKIVQRATCRRDFFRPFQNTQAKRACSTREDYSPAFYSNAGVAPAPRRDTIGLGRFKVDVEQILPIERADLEWTHLAYEVFRLLNEGNLEGAHDVYRRTSTATLDSASVTLLMRGYNNITDGRSAMKLFTAYSKARLAPSLSCIEEALRAMAILGKPAAADILLQKVTAYGMKLSRQCVGYIASLFLRSGLPADALHLLNAADSVNPTQPCAILMGQMVVANVALGNNTAAATYLGRMNALGMLNTSTITDIMTSTLTMIYPMENIIGMLRALEAAGHLRMEIDTYNVLCSITMKMNRPIITKQLIEYMNNRFQPNLETFLQLMKWSGMNKDTGSVIEIWDRMMYEGMTPTERHLICAFSAIRVALTKDPDLEIPHSGIRFVFDTYTDRNHSGYPTMAFIELMRIYASRQEWEAVLRTYDTMMVNSEMLPNLAQPFADALKATAGLRNFSKMFSIGAVMLTCNPMSLPGQLMRRLVGLCGFALGWPVPQIRAFLKRLRYDRKSFFKRSLAHLRPLDSESWQLIVNHFPKWQYQFKGIARAILRRRMREGKEKPAAQQRAKRKAATGAGAASSRSNPIKN